MTVITNAELVLKDSKGNVGTVRSVTDNDIVKIRNAITDIGKLVDPVSHLPIKATATTVGVVQLADAEAIAAGTTGRVVDAKQLQDAVMGVTPANCVTNVAAGSTANKIKVTKDDYTTTITIDNVEHASFADQADTAASANSVAWDNVSDKPSSYTPASHTHDDRYYTESEIDAKLTDYLQLAGGNVTGNLTVQDKNVVRSVNGVNADANGNVIYSDIAESNNGSSYIKFIDGTLIQWGAGQTPNTEVNFGVPFLNAENISIIGTVAGEAVPVVCNIHNYTKTYFRFNVFDSRTGDGTYKVLSFIAIGRWK